MFQAYVKPLQNMFYGNMFQAYESPFRTCSRETCSKPM